MKVKTKCKNCKHHIRFWVFASDRVELAKSKGKFIKLTCKRCRFEAKYYIDFIYAYPNKVIYVSSSVISVLAVFIIFLLIKNFLIKEIYNPYIVTGLIVPCTIPFVIHFLLVRSDQKRVRLFNRFKFGRTPPD